MRFASLVQFEDSDMVRGRAGDVPVWLFVAPPVRLLNRGRSDETDKHARLAAYQQLFVRDEFTWVTGSTGQVVPDLIFDWFFNSEPGFTAVTVDGVPVATETRRFRAIDTLAGTLDDLRTFVVMRPAGIDGTWPALIDR